MADLAERIEKAIDKNVTGSLTVIGSGGAASIAPKSLTELMEFAKVMALAGFAVRPKFRNNPGACMALSLQAFRWGLDPFSVANKAYITTNKGGDEQIAYEAQLIHAVINLRAPLEGRLRAVYSGEGPTRQCKIVGRLKGEPEPFEYESPKLKDIAVQNSPLWKADTDQQLWYYATRAWARRHFPEIILGAYTDDEIVAQERHYDPDRAIDVTPPPRPTREDANSQAEPDPFDVVSFDGEVHKVTDAAEVTDAFVALLKESVARGRDAVDGVWETNTLSGQLRERGWADLAEKCHRAYADALTEAARPPKQEPVVGDSNPQTLFDRKG